MLTKKQAVLFCVLEELILSEEQTTVEVKNNILEGDF